MRISDWSSDVCSSDLLNIGGGFGIPYFPKDEPLALAQVGERLAPLVEEVSARQPAAEVVVELGRYIVGEAGLYVSRVVDGKESRGLVFLVTDGAMPHQLAHPGTFGPVTIVNATWRARVCQYV